MDARRGRIASDFRQIEHGKEELRKSKEDYEQRLAKIEDEARIRIRDAIQEGQKLAEHVKLDAQKEAEAMLNKVRELIESERAKASVDLRDQIVALTIASAEKLIRERLDQEKHRQLISDFIDSMSSARP
jgi:F-type H+-transporting ATPase subunit b